MIVVGGSTGIMWHDFIFTTFKINTENHSTSPRMKPHQTNLTMLRKWDQIAGEHAEPELVYDWQIQDFLQGLGCTQDYFSGGGGVKR